MESKGVTNDTVLALDFSHFCTERNNLNKLVAQLSENYIIKTELEAKGKIWFLKGTTRPEGVTLEKDQHSSWVEFMSDVAASYGCVLAHWTLESPELAQIFESELIEHDMP